MKRAWGCFLILGLAADLAADDAMLREARQRWLRGNYAEARELYETLAKDAQFRDQASIGLGFVQQSQGEYDRALSTLDAALKDSDQNADLHVRRAELLYLRGRWEDALAAAERALAIRAEHLAARWVRAQVHRDRGELQEAEADVRWIVRTYSQRSDKAKDIKRPEELLIVGLAGSENARWHSLAEQFPFILNEVYADALKTDKDYWPAEYQAGMLLLEKYNRPEALKALDKALTINPNAAEVHAAKGMAALHKLEFQEAEDSAKRALEINPNLTEALRLRADVQGALGDAAAALRDLEKARTVNPREEATLGRIAASFFLQRKTAEFDRIVAEVMQFDPKPGLFWLTLADQLEDRRRFLDAERFYQKAIEVRPMVPWARNGLGMLYMRMGREKEALEVLTKAFEADAFNVRVANTLKVLRHLERYATIKTEHFELRYDPNLDRPLAGYLAEVLEATYKDLAAKYRYEPTGPILIEVFNNHDMFSGRVTALPDLHTIGACTGRMIAMVSPRAKGIDRPFNWGRVVRHELVHIFNLEQSNFQCPHWLTEGLAVIEEGLARPQEWNVILRERMTTGKLLTLDDINLGFIRPRSPEEWHLAYCQSQLYVEFLQQRFGPEVIGDLLNAYRDGLDTTGVLKQVCKVDKTAFEKDYHAHVRKLVETMRTGGRKLAGSAAKPLDFKQLVAAQEKEPENPDLAAQLAEQYFTRKRRGDARKLVEAVLAKHPKHGLALYVKSRLLWEAGEEHASQKLLEDGLDPKAPEPKLLRELGRRYFEARQFDKAAKVLEQGREAEPHDRQWLVELARVYTQTKENAKLIDILTALVPMDGEDLATRKRLAQLLLDAGRYAQAERSARQALEIDILDAEARTVLDKALRGQKKDAEAERLKKLLAGAE